MTVTKYHLSTSGQMAPCTASERACPRPGHIDLNDQNTWDNMFTARARVSPKFSPAENRLGVERHVAQIEYLATVRAARHILNSIPEGERLKLSKFLDQIVANTPTSRKNAQQVFDHLLEDGYVDYAQGQGVTKRDPKQHRNEPIEVEEPEEDDFLADVADSYSTRKEADQAELAERFAAQAATRQGAVDELASLL